jgi:hypothetical protein
VFLSVCRCLKENEAFLELSRIKDQFWGKVGARIKQTTPRLDYINTRAQQRNDQVQGSAIEGTRAAQMQKNTLN